MPRIGPGAAVLALACGLCACAHDVVLGQYEAPPADTASGGSAAGGSEASAGGTNGAGGYPEDGLHSGGAEHSGDAPHAAGGFHAGAGGFSFGGEGPIDDDPGVEEGPNDDHMDGEPGAGASGP